MASIESDNSKKKKRLTHKHIDMFSPQQLMPLCTKYDTQKSYHSFHSYQDLVEREREGAGGPSKSKNIAQQNAKLKCTGGTQKMGHLSLSLPAKSVSFLLRWRFLCALQSCFQHCQCKVRPANDEAGRGVASAAAVCKQVVANPGRKDIKCCAGIVCRREQYYLRWHLKGWAWELARSGILCLSAPLVRIVLAGASKINFSSFEQ